MKPSYLTYMIRGFKYANLFVFFLKKGFTLLDTGFFLRNLSCELNQKSEPEARVNLWLTALGQMSYLKCVTHSGVACDVRVTCLGFLQVWEEVQHGGACNGMAAWARFKPEPWTRVRNLALKPSHKCKAILERTNQVIPNVVEENCPESLLWI